jgi:hypothetical protein
MALLKKIIGTSVIVFVLVFSFEKSAAKHCFATFDIGEGNYIAPFNIENISVDTLLSPDNNINLPVTMATGVCTCTIDSIWWTHNSSVINHSSSYTITDTGVYDIYSKVDTNPFTGHYCLGPYYFHLNLRIGYLVTTSINEINSGASFSLYPNPFTHTFSLEVKTDNVCNLTCQIYDCTGREIKEVNIENVFGELKLTEDFEALSKGVYFLRATIGNRLFENKLVHL